MLDQVNEYTFDDFKKCRDNAEDISAQWGKSFALDGIEWDVIERADDWLFIMCSVRTGSTALSKLLNDHSEIRMLCEDNVVRNLCALLSSPFPHVEPYIQPSFGDLGSKCKASTIRALCETYRSHRADASCRYFGDKMVFLNWLPFVLKMFPAVKVVAPVRHPLGIIDSLLRRGFVKHTFPSDDDDEVPFIMFHWYHFYASALKHSEDIFFLFFDEMFDEETMANLMVEMEDFLDLNPRGELIDVSTDYVRGPAPLDRWRQNEEVMSIVNVWLNAGFISESERKILMLPSKVWVNHHWNQYCGEGSLRGNDQCPF